MSKNMPPSLTLLNQIARHILDKKGFNILGLDVREVSSINDYLIIAEGNSKRHVSGMARSLIEMLSSYGIEASYTEGIPSSEWVVIDYLTIAVHLFMPGLREEYNLEELWEKSLLILLAIKD